jgi:hypothetical protein
MPDGSILGIGTDNTLFTIPTLPTAWISVPNSGAVIDVTLMLDGSILGVGTNSSLYRRATLTSPWVAIPNSGSVIGVIAMQDGSLVGIGTDNALYARATLTSPWTKLANSGSVIGVTQMPDETLLGIGMNKKLYTQHVPAAPLTEQQLRTAIATYGPVLRFHPAEQYKMCSVEWFLQHATLHDKKTGSDIRHPTVAQLPTEPEEAGRYWLVLDDGAKGGNPSTAKGYVHALWTPSHDYTDLQFWFFYAYNGPGTAHVNGLVMDTIVHTGNVDLAPLGEHFGDWECCMVRIDNNTKQPIGIWLSQHSSGQYFNASELNQFARVNGQQFVVYASRNGHAVYPQPGSNYTEHYKIPPGGIPAALEFFLRNDTAAGGQSLDCGKLYEIVSADWLEPQIAPAQWLRYPYRWGPEGTTTHMSPGTVSNILNAGIGPLGILVPGFVVVEMAGLLLPLFVKDDVNGPSGPKQKSTWVGEY